VCAGIQNQTQASSGTRNRVLQSMATKVCTTGQRPRSCPRSMSVSVSRGKTIIGGAKIRFMKKDFQNAAASATPAPGSSPAASRPSTPKEKSGKTAAKTTPRKAQTTKR
jgi:hypothetical protein